MDVLTWLVAVAAFSAILMWSGVIPAILKGIDDTRARRESERFQREPRVGDKAGYPIKQIGVLTEEWFVGEVVEVQPSDSDYGPKIWIAATLTTALGPHGHKAWGFASQLRWFPPDTPLGLNVIDVEGESK